MNWYKYFKEEVLIKFETTIELEESFFQGGDFGDVQRVSFIQNALIVDIDFFSNGGLDMSVIDQELSDDYELLNVLYFPEDEHEKIKQSFDKLLTIVNSF